MKVLLINGSPKKEGCTYTALKEVADELERNGYDEKLNGAIRDFLTDFSYRNSAGKGLYGLWLLCKDRKSSVCIQ